MYTAVASKCRQMEFSCFGSGDKCHVELALLGQGCTVVGRVCWEVFWEICTLEGKSMCAQWIYGPLHLLSPDLQKQALSLGKRLRQLCDPRNFTALITVSNAVPFPKFLTLTFQFQALSCMQILPKQNGEYCRFWNDPGSVLYNLTFFLVFYSWLQFLPFSQTVDERKNEQDGWVKYSPRVEA